MKKQTEIKSPVLTGIVTQFSVERGFGIVVIEGHNRSYNLSTKTGPKVVKTGTRAPYFNGARAEGFPSNGDLVALVLTEEDGKMKVTQWGHAADWKRAEALIAGRKQTLSARSANFMAKFRPAAIAAITAKRPEAMPKQSPKPLRTVIFSTACIA